MFQDKYVKCAMLCVESLCLDRSGLVCYRKEAFRVDRHITVRHLGTPDSRRARRADSRVFLVAAESSTVI